MKTSSDFDIDKDLPNAPSQTAPSNGATITNDTTILLDWNPAVDPGCSVPASYEIVLDNSSNCASPTHTWTKSSSFTYQTTHSLSNGTYYWRVRAKDNLNNYGAYSDCRSFTINVDQTPPVLSFSDNIAA